MRRTQNLYFDRKSLGFKRGIRPASKKELRASKTSFERGVRAKVRTRKGAARKQASSLFRQLQGEAQREAKGREMAKQDKALWEELYGRSNPRRVFPGNLTTSERSALRKLVRLKTMATKKRKRKKNSQKGKMPAGLRRYWAKKRAAKAKRRNPKKRRTTKPRRKRATPRVRNYRRTARKPAKRRARRNPPRPRKPRILKAPAGMSAQRYAKLLRQAGVRARVMQK
jgi:hypothetical protein